MYWFKFKLLNFWFMKAASDFFSCVPVNSPLILCLWTMRFPTGTTAFLVQAWHSCTEKWRLTIHLDDFYTKKSWQKGLAGTERRNNSLGFLFFPLPALPEPRGVLTLVGAWLSRGVLHSTPLWKFCSQGMLDKSWISATDLNYWEMFWQLEWPLPAPVNHQILLFSGSWNFNFVQSYLVRWNGGRCSFWNSSQESWEAQNHHPQGS